MAQVEDVLAQARRELAEGLQDEFLQRLPSEAAVTLATLPQWTPELLDALNLPAAAGVQDGPALVDLLVARGVAVRRRQNNPGGGSSVVGWLTEDARRRWIGAAADVTDLPGLRGTLVRTVSTATAVPASTTMWARMPTSSQAVMLVTEAALAGGDIALAAANVSIARHVEPYADAGYATALARAERLIRHERVRRRDRERLRDFVARPEQVEPLVAHLRGEGSAWALHLLGVGGVGKTMLLRYLSSGRLAEEQDLGQLNVARIDFDHVSPDYPARRPAHLLLEWADQLEGVARSDRAASTVSLTRTYGRAIHRRALDEAVTEDDTQMQAAITAFAELLSSLDGTTVLVLDTCEELAKLHPAGVEVPAIERAFRLLETLHDRVAGVRVILAGRRYLARGGAGWQVPPGTAPRSVVGLVERPYLALERLHGFDRGDAERLLRTPVEATAPVPSAALVEAFLEAAPDLGSAEDPRYNPFLIEVFRQWFGEEPTLTPDAVGEGRTAYVRARIVRRLADLRVRSVLPVLAELGRVDRNVLRPFATEQAWSMDALVELLAEQEWVDVEVDPATDERVLSVLPPLRPLLAEWLDHDDQRVEAQATRATLRAHLPAALETQGLAELTPEVVVGALRLLTEEEAVDAWVALERRIEEDGRWGWALNVIPRVRGALQECLSARPKLDAAISLSEIAALRRRGIRGVPAMLARVRALLPEEAEAAGHAAVLLARVDAQLEDPAANPSGRWSSITPPRATALVGGSRIATDPKAVATGAAAETIRRITRDLAARDELHPTVRLAGVIALASRLAPADAVEELRAAEGLAERAAAAPRRHWADLPDWDARDGRVWLALNESRYLLRDASLASTDLHARLDRWEALAQQATKHIDADRLSSAVLELRQLGGPLEEVTLDHWRQQVVHERAEGLASAVHDLHAPLVVTVAQAYRRAGLPRPGEELLLEALEQARERGDAQAELDATRALVVLAARMRWPRYAPSLMDNAAGGPNLWLRRLVAAYRFLAEGQGAPPYAVEGGGWLTTGARESDLFAEAGGLDRAQDPVELLAARSAAIRRADPIGSVMLLTVAGMRSLAWRVSVGPRYTSTISPLGLPHWGQIGQAEPSDQIALWAGWLARWWLLDGSGPAEHTSIPERSESWGRPAVVETTRTTAPESRSTAELPGPRVKQSRPALAAPPTGQSSAQHPPPSAPLSAGSRYRASHNAPPLPMGAPSAATSPRGCLALLVGALLLGVVVVAVVLSSGSEPPANGAGATSDVSLLGWVLGGLAVILALAGAAAVVRVIVPWTRARRGRRAERPTSPFVSWIDVAVDGDVSRPSVRVTGSDQREVDRLRGLLDASPSVPPLTGPMMATLRGDRHLMSEDIESVITPLQSRPDAWQIVWLRRQADAGPTNPSWHGRVRVHAPKGWAERELIPAYAARLPPDRSNPRSPAGGTRLSHFMGAPALLGRDSQALLIDSLKDTPDVWVSGEIVAEQAWITVLQMVPSTAEGLAARDSEMRLLRSLAMAVHRDGANLVIALPSLPTNVARKVVLLLADVAGRPSKPDRSNVVQLLYMVKRTIVEAGDAADVTAQGRRVAQHVIALW